LFSVGSHLLGMDAVDLLPPGEEPISRQGPKGSGVEQPPWLPSAARS
jgi:hypothetical protein